MIEKYFEEELRYLYEAGRAFARAHPDQARELNIDAVGGRDEEIERLLEGFAFLTARVREKLDGAFPEFSDGLVNMLWPQLQQEVPSATIIEFRPRPGLLQGSKELPRGVEMLSNPVGPHGIPCVFTTTQKVVLNPIELVSIDTKVDNRGNGVLTFHFRLEQAVQWSALKLDPLRIFVHAEMPVAVALHELLTRHTTDVHIAADEDRAEIVIPGQASVTPANFHTHELMLPGSTRIFPGNELLLEYFLFPEKFMFFDLHGFSRLKNTDPAPQNLSVTVQFDTGIPHAKPFRADNFRLFCSPALNMFRRTIEPVPTRLTDDEYCVIADAERIGSIAAHSIISVQGIDRTSGERITYEPQFIVRQASKSNRVYSTCYRQSAQGTRELILAIGGNRLVEGEVREETLSIDAWCTNGTLPREEVQEGGIVSPGNGFPEGISFKNITRPTLPGLPPAREAAWTFISHLGATYVSLANGPALREFLRLYDWSASEGRKRRIDALHEVAVRPSETHVNGALVRGIEFGVTVDEAGFSDVNDMHLFGEVLSAFLRQYVSINSFCRLVLVTKPSGRRLLWDAVEGKKKPI